MTTELKGALSELAGTLSEHPEIADALRASWRVRGESGRGLPRELGAATAQLASTLPPLTRDDDPSSLQDLFDDGRGELLLTWCTESAWRRDVRVAPVLAIAHRRPELRVLVPAVARQRVAVGPLRDALACAPFLGDMAQLRSRAHKQVRARLDILVWEAGARALEVPTLGGWLWGHTATFDALVGEPAHHALRGRVLAARCLEVSARGMPPTTDPELIGRTLQALQPLLLHPEPYVWVHAARALGRLTGALDQLEGMLLDWVLGESPVLRQRAITAFASLPAERLGFLASQLAAIVRSPDEDPWVLAAVGAATPYLFFERRDIWDQLATRVLAGDGGGVTARALARGLAVLWRRGSYDPEVEAPMRALRDRARHALTAGHGELRRWMDVIVVTDTIDGAERDPLDLEIGLDNLMRLAAQYDDAEADARAARFAMALAPTFREAHRIALGSGRPRQRAAATNALEGCARAFALRLWRPLLATSIDDDPIEEPDLEATWQVVAGAPAEILDLVQQRRQDGDELSRDEALEVLAVRLGGYALDACGHGVRVGPGRGPTAHDTCHWLRKVEGLSDGSRELPLALQSALSGIFWRLVDITRGTTLGVGDDVRWLGPFAAWWALVIDRPAMLLQLATALPMMVEGALQHCVKQAEALRTAVSSGTGDGAWGPAAEAALGALHAEGTELADALSGLARALKAFGAAAGGRPGLETHCMELVLAGDRLQAALANPVKALHPAGDDSDEDTLARQATENAPRVAALVARAIRARELQTIDVWLASLGPVASALLQKAVESAIRRTPPPLPRKKITRPKLIAGYELVKRLGEGGIGSVWLVRKPGADRLFVLKIPKGAALSSASEVERAQILASFEEEATALAGLYHPNVASIVDRGVSEEVPFLVLEYLIGCDLQQYASARLMTLFELRKLVLEACAGLSALHGAGLVHRDVKPANLWVRLALSGGEPFDPNKHRDPAIAPPLSTVLIDFGMVRPIRIPPEAGGRFVAGTAGYIAPEQVLDPVELDGRADVYALAATIYNVTTGRSFFDEIDEVRDRILAHMKRDPFEDATRLSPYPAAVAQLLRAATARDPRDRPSPQELGQLYAAAL